MVPNIYTGLTAETAMARSLSIFEKNNVLFPATKVTEKPASNMTQLIRLIVGLSAGGCPLVPALYAFSLARS